MAGLKNMSFVGPMEEKDEIRPPAASGNWKLEPSCGKEMETLVPLANSLTS